MTLEKKLETIALLAKHLREYAPFVAAIGSAQTKKGKQLILAELSDKFLNDSDFRADILKVAENLLGKTLSELDSKVVKDIQVSWKTNRLDTAFAVLLELGILDRQDVANLIWIKTNWDKNAK